MHEGEMGEVAQIVDDQQPVGPIVHIARKAAPFGVGERRIIDDQIWDRPFRRRRSRSRSGRSARRPDSFARRALPESCPGRESGCICRPDRISCRDTCTGYRRPRSGPSRAEPRDGNSGRRAPRFFRSRPDRARWAAPESCGPASCRRSVHDSSRRRTRNSGEEFRRRVMTPSLFRASAFIFFHAIVYDIGVYVIGVTGRTRIVWTHYTALLPTRQFAPVKARRFREALEAQAHSDPGRRPVVDLAAPGWPADRLQMQIFVPFSGTCSPLPHPSFTWRAYR